MKIAIHALAATALLSSSVGAFAQTEAAPVIAAQRVSAGTATALPANTELLLSMNDDLTTKGIEEGHKFRMTLVRDVMIGDYVVIPKGTPAVGEVTWKTGKGAFGKSGKMEVALRYLDMNGRHVPIEGKYRQEGEGNTAATVAGVIAAGVFAGFITGKSAKIPQAGTQGLHHRSAAGRVADRRRRSGPGARPRPADHRRADCRQPAGHQALNYSRARSS
jgi:hypothetical protein